MVRKETLETVNGYRVIHETRCCENYDLVYEDVCYRGYQKYDIQEKLYLQAVLNEVSIELTRLLPVGKSIGY